MRTLIIVGLIVQFWELPLLRIQALTVYFSQLVKYSHVWIVGVVEDIDWIVCVFGSEVEVSGCRY